MRRVDDDFGQQELVLIYIAKRLKEATTLEEHLTAAGVDYLVECDTYRGGLIFVSERVGAFFYVNDADAGPARQVLTRHGYRPYETAG
ncbi:MAG TPA: hypothetical protein VLG93_06370 [Sulfuricaulis sp.]|nr:hypothetical protein [Sulfuricaulis sp.]